MRSCDYIYLYVVSISRDDVTPKISAETLIFIRLFFYSPLWEMMEDGIDLKTINWAQH